METGHQDRLGQTPPSYPAIGSIRGSGPDQRGGETLVSPAAAHFPSGLSVRQAGTDGGSSPPPLVGEGGVSDRSGTATPAGSAPSLRRISTEVLAAVPGEDCFRCGTQALVVIGDGRFPYCEYHGSDAMAARILFAWVDARRVERGAS